MTLGQREFTVIKPSILPIRRVMTQGTICSVSAFMGINFFVAGITINRRSLELTVNMTVFTLHFDMLSIQLERKNIMVYIHIVPVIRIMANRAVKSISAFMLIHCLVAGIAILWCPSVRSVRVAILAFNRTMPAIQFKISQIMIEFRRLPAFNCMTSSTVLSKASVVFIGVT